MFSQTKKFNRRKRQEDPDRSTVKVLNDDFLRFVYTNILNAQIGKIGSSSGQILEIGSAGGITKTLNDKIITSDVRASQYVDLVLDASAQLPFKDESLDGIIAKDVLHHIPDPLKHFKEVSRVLKSGGVVVYAEPNWNILSRAIFRYLHPEPWLNSSEWVFESSDPMFANQALPWIIFVRDRHKFEELFPQFEIDLSLNPLNGFAFLISGGVFNRTMISSRFLIKISNAENRRPRWMRNVGLTRIIVLKKLS